MAALVNIYFGCGCFWHIQHELIQAERSILSRTDDQLTTLTGYAAGTGTNSIGALCYPYSNRALGDHELHHAEVVGLQIPRDDFPAFAAEYWRLFVGINRVDVQDRGPEYRAVIGLPGGMNSELLAEIDAAQAGIASQTFELRAGVGGDADTLGQALVWVYDTDEFPFHQAEVYHQFHDDMVERYPQVYNDLNGAFVSDCRAVPTGCHNDPITQVTGCPEQVAVVNTNLVAAGSSSPATSSGGSGDLPEDGVSESVVSVQAGGSGEMAAQDESGGGSGEMMAEDHAEGGSGGVSMSNDDADGDDDAASMPAENAGGDQGAGDNGDVSATFQLPMAWLAHGLVLATLISRT